jgi:Tryptophan halogenase
MQKIVIVGGGAAGWMAAIAIASRFPEKQITILDPVALGPLGVGESVTGVVVQFVNDPLHGFSFGDFFRACNVTFKTGIWYKNWQGLGTEYLAPIDSPPEYFKYHYATNAEEFYAFAAADAARLSDVQIYSQLMRHNKTDHLREPNGTINTQLAYASCHFDAMLFANWLRASTNNRPNITHIDSSLASFEHHAETGYIVSITTAAGQKIAGDFFLDCSGFNRLLLAPAYAPQWKSYSNYIKVDSAIPCFVPFEQPGFVPNYTMATALPNGWMWQIPTQERLGRGYVYSSRYVTDEQAIAEFNAAGGNVTESPRILRFNPGRFEKQWVGNVCTIGLAGGFIEPLEASTIHGMYVQIRLLTDLILPFCTHESLPVFSQQYNQLINFAYDDYVDFISLHYKTGRHDTEFWRDYQKQESVTATNLERLEKWKYAFPSREDFSPVYTQLAALNTGLVIWAPMLCGLNLWSTEHAKRLVALSRHPPMLRENVARYIQFRHKFTTNGLNHNEAIAHFLHQT